MLLSIKYSILLWHKPLLCCLCTLASVATSQQSTQLNLPTFLSAAFHSPPSPNNYHQSYIFTCNISKRKSAVCP